MSRILLIQSDPKTARRNADLVAATPALKLAGVVHTLAHARDALSEGPCELIVADVRLADGMFATLIKELGLRPQGRPQTLAIVAALHDPHLMHAMRSGADGYFVAGRSLDALLKAMRQVIAGESPMAPEIARRVLEHFEALDQQALTLNQPRSALQLSDVERQMLQWINEGYLLHEIAQGMQTTTQQVGIRTRALYRKMQFDAQAGSQALRAA
jgi:DNA-binding NarL/FixJ family response regulator